MTLNPGTRVVLRAALRRDPLAPLPAGSVGVVQGLPEAGFHRIRFGDDHEASLDESAVTVLASFKEGASDDPPGSEELFRAFEHCIVYRCVVGSRAFGLDDDRSDTDLRGIFLPSADLSWSLAGVPEQIERSESQECYWELGKFLRLALKANPNILECLYTPLIETAEPVAHELLAIRGAFLSKLVYQTYNGYVMSQFKKLKDDERIRGGYRWKHAMHLIRLLLSGIEVLRQGTVLVDVGEHRDRLLAIKRGELTFEEIDAWRLALHRTFEEAFHRTALPERPDVDTVNAFLLRARRSAL